MQPHNRKQGNGTGTGTEPDGNGPASIDTKTHSTHTHQVPHTDATSSSNQHVNISHEVAFEPAALEPAALEPAEPAVLSVETDEPNRLLSSSSSLIKCL